MLPLPLQLPGNRTWVAGGHLGTKLVTPCYTDLKQNIEWTVLGYAGSFSTHQSFTASPEAEIAHSLIPLGNWAVNFQHVAHNCPGLEGL